MMGARRHNRTAPSASSVATLRVESRRYLAISLATTVVFLVLLAAYALGVTGHLVNQGAVARPVQAPSREALTIVVARTPGGPRAWKSYAQALASVSNSSGIPITVKYAMSSGELVALFESGEADAAFSCNSCFLELQTRGEVVPLVSPVIDGAGTDTAVLVVAESSSVGRFEDLRGRSVAVAKAPSLAGNAYLKLLLDERSLDAGEFLGQVIVGSSQESNLEALHAGDVDAAVVNRSQLVGLPAARYRILVESEPFGLAPFVVSTRMNEADREALRSGLIGFKPMVAHRDGLVLEGFMPFRDTGREFLLRLKSALESKKVNLEGVEW